MSRKSINVRMYNLQNIAMKIVMAQNKEKSLNERLKKCPEILKLKECNLIRAVVHNNVEAVQYLLEIGVSPNSRDIMKRGTLHIAASKGYKDIVELLLKAGADPNIQDSIKNTPLHLASCNHNLAIINLLMQYGADIHSLDIRGKSPLELVQSKLKMLRWSYKNDDINKFCFDLEQVMDIMRSVQKKEETGSNKSQDSVDQVLDNLGKLKIVIDNGKAFDVDEQMNSILSELEKINI